MQTKCRGCRGVVLSSDLFCPGCGSALGASSCQHCNMPGQSGDVFCGGCGRDYAPGSNSPPALLVGTLGLPPPLYATGLPELPASTPGLPELPAPVYAPRPAVSPAVSPKLAVPNGAPAFNTKTKTALVLSACGFLAIVLICVASFHPSSSYSDNSSRPSYSPPPSYSQPSAAYAPAPTQQYSAPVPAQPYSAPVTSPEPSLPAPEGYDQFQKRLDEQKQQAQRDQNSRTRADLMDQRADREQAMAQKQAKIDEYSSPSAKEMIRSDIVNDQKRITEIDYQLAALPQ